MTIRYNASAAIDHLVWNYAAGEVVKIEPSTVSPSEIRGIVTTRKQYGEGHYTYRIDRVKKTVTMRGFSCGYQVDDCVSTGGSESRS